MITGVILNTGSVTIVSLQCVLLIELKRFQGRRDSYKPIVMIMIMFIIIIWKFAAFPLNTELVIHSKLSTDRRWSGDPVVWESYMARTPTKISLR